jgi:hypothetical protein
MVVGDNEARAGCGHLFPCKPVTAFSEAGHGNFQRNSQREFDSPLTADRMQARNNALQ